MVLGTPEYMSPEQATGQETDHRVDKYALGCILYEMLTGDVPFKGENAPKTLTKHVFDAVVPPTRLRPDLEIPVIVEEIVMRMLQKKPADRYADMRDAHRRVRGGARQDRVGRRAGAQDLRRRRCAARRRRRPTPSTELPRNKAPIYVAVGVSVAAVVVLAGVAVTRMKKTPRADAGRSRRSDDAGRGAADGRAAGAGAAPSAGRCRRTRCRFRSATQPAGAEVYAGAELLGRVARRAQACARARTSLTFTIRTTASRTRSARSCSTTIRRSRSALAPKRDKVAVRAARPRGKRARAAARRRRRRSIT